MIYVIISVLYCTEDILEFLLDMIGLFPQRCRKNSAVKGAKKAVKRLLGFRELRLKYT